MGLRILTNTASIAAQRALKESAGNQEKSYERLASGKRITSSADDAAGLAISDNLRAQIRSMGQAERNANDGISFVQVAEGGVNEVSNILVRLRELAIQASSDTVGDRERSFINREYESLLSEVDRIANVTTFNGTPLLNGQAEKESLEIQVGIRNHHNDRISFNANEADVRAEALGLDGLNTISIDDARESIDKIDEALSRVNGARAGLGAMQNKLHSTVNNIGIAKENLAHARSRIADADVAEETSKLVKDNILQSAGISVLAQANQVPQSALRLL